MPVPEWKPLNRDPDDDDCSWKAVYRQMGVPTTFEDKSPVPSDLGINKKLIEYGIKPMKRYLWSTGVNGIRN